MCALAQAGLKRQEFPCVMLLVLMRSQCGAQRSWEMASPPQLELGSGRSSFGLPYNINSPPCSSTTPCYGEAVVLVEKGVSAGKWPYLEGDVWVP